MKTPTKATPAPSNGLNSPSFAGYLRAFLPSIFLRPQLTQLATNVDEAKQDIKNLDNQIATVKAMLATNQAKHKLEVEQAVTRAEEFAKNCCKSEDGGTSTPINNDLPKPQ